MFHELFYVIVSAKEFVEAVKICLFQAVEEPREHELRSVSHGSSRKGRQRRCALFGGSGEEIYI